MDTKVKVSDEMQIFAIRKRGFETLEKLFGCFQGELWRNGKLITIVSFSNGATDVGKQYLLGAGFNAVTPITTWYLGLIDASGGTPILAPTDTMATHTGWNEFILYNETTRQTWAKTLNTLTNQMVSSAAAQFNIPSSFTGTGSLGGGFLVSNNTKNGTTGTLWATGVFNSPVPIQASDEFRLNYVAGL